MPRPAELVAGVEPRLDVRRVVSLVGRADYCRWLLAAGQPGNKHESLDQQFVGVLLSGAARVPVPPPVHCTWPGRASGGRSQLLYWDDSNRLGYRFLLPH